MRDITSIGIALIAIVITAVVVLNVGLIWGIPVMMTATLIALEATPDLT